ncbi:ABC transporter substrate-binding protein [Sulfurimonas sp.]|uniref:ABC transporter substrate-binding protein n=1 Tax=Sulfurimonas sp. TaxID=2022749 RepID=UPI00356AF5EC
MIIKTITKLTLLLTISFVILSANSLDKCKNKRIISQSPYITHALDFFGMKECIVGASIYDEQVDPYLPRTGKVFVPDKDAIAKLKPDFIFTSDWTKKSVMADITSKGAKTFMLHGFQSMEQVENNLYVIGNVLKIKEFQNKVKNFSKEWRDLARSIKHKNKKVLLMSACSHDPYSYGTNTYLGDMFSEAGFDVVDKSNKVKIFHISKDKNELDEFIKEFKPDFIFGFVPYTQANVCSVLETNKKLPIIYLNGDKFLHPAPTLLDGLKELKSKENEY